MLLGLFFSLVGSIALTSGIIQEQSFSIPSNDYTQDYYIEFDNNKYAHTVILFNFPFTVEGTVKITKANGTVVNLSIQTTSFYYPSYDKFTFVSIHILNSMDMSAKLTFIPFTSNTPMKTFISQMANDVFTVGRESNSDIKYQNGYVYNYANLAQSNFSFRADSHMTFDGTYNYKYYVWSTRTLTTNSYVSSYSQVTLQVSCGYGTVFQIKTGKTSSLTYGTRIYIEDNKVQYLSGTPVAYDVESDLAPATYTPPPTYTPSPRPDHSDQVIGGLALACAVYFSIVMFLLVADIILACIHPNRLYRSGFDCACFYCCCYNYYSPFGVYYTSHTYTPCFCFSCGTCHSSDCNGGNDKATVIIFLIILLIILVMMAFILLYIFFELLCAKDEEERRYESQYKQGRFNEINQPMLDPSMQAPPMQPAPPSGYYPQQQGYAPQPPGYAPQPPQQQGYVPPPQQPYPPQGQTAYYPPPPPASPYATPVPPQQPHYQSDQKADNPYDDEYNK